MVIVAVVILVFLGITIRRGNVVISESREIYQFLESGMEYTSDCEVRFAGDYSSLGELFGECLEGSKCLNEKTSCDVLNTTLKGLFEASWQVGSDRPIKAYKFNSIYSSDSSKEEIISLSKGNCTGRIRGASYLSPAFPGVIESTLELCY
ncbi:MAG: hypothetical protein IIA87_02150 [Nanoarchaeota archaeon]|nr:hypothetical protein [Nanoarchaeota archaeon]